MHENNFFPKKSVMYNCLVETLCWRWSSVNSKFWLLCYKSHDWIFWMIDLGKQHFEEWCTWCTWVIFRNHKKQTIIAGKDTYRIEISLWVSSWLVKLLSTQQTHLSVCLRWVKSQDWYMEMCKIWNSHCSVDFDLSLMGYDIILTSKYLWMFFEELTASILHCSQGLLTLNMVTTSSSKTLITWIYKW